MTNKHPKPSKQPVERPDDLDRDPAIGQSKSLFGGQSDEEAELIEGENTIEGDIENDAGLGDGADSSLGANQSIICPVADIARPPTDRREIRIRR